MKVCHLTSVHPSRDTRIFYKECRGLAKAGYDVTLIAVHHKKETEVVDGVKIIPFPLVKNRFLRILFSPLRMFFMARKQKAGIYHFHDPELIVAGLLLKFTGAKVIFDIHENIVKQIKVNRFLLFPRLLSRLFVPFNYISARCFHLVLAENSYEEIYKKYTHRYKIILNMPDVAFFQPYYLSDRSANRDIFYIGRVAKIRGAEVTLKALHLLKKKNIVVNIHFVGDIAPVLKKELESLDYFNEIKENVIFYGRKNLEAGYEISGQCLVGVSVLSPVENYLYSYSTKIFEYMAVAMPVITSNFPLYKDIVERYECGFCIDPGDPGALAEAVEYLLNHPDQAREMGAKGRQAALKYFDWQIQERKLLELYQSI